MNSASFFKAFVTRWGVELSLVLLIALGVYFYQHPQFLVSAHSEPMSDEVVTTLQKIAEIIERAENSEKLFIHQRKAQDLADYNQQVLLLNYQMGQLAKLVVGDEGLHKKSVQLNRLLHGHFEAVNKVLTERQQGRAVRVPASASILPQVAETFPLQTVSKPLWKRTEFFYGILGFLAALIILSRLWQKQEVRRQKSLATSLQTRSILLDSILNNMSEALIVTDEQGYFTHYNAAAQRIIGTRIKEVATTVSVEELGFFHVASGEAYSQKNLPFYRALRGEQVDDLEIFVQNETHPQGTYISLSSRSLNDIQGGIAGALVVFKDISRRKMIEQEWAKAREAALEASLKKSDFLAAMSHEIRTPMNGVIGMTTLLADTPLNEEQKEYVGTVKRSAESLLMLINDILDYSKIEAGKISLDPQPFDLHFLARDITEIFRATLAEKNVGLKLQISEKIPKYFVGDSGRLRQILVNLIGNAVKFTEKGFVSLDVSLTEASAQNLHLKFEVKDTGPGLKEEERRSLFQKYFQTKTGAKFGGTGLGLSICKQLVNLMQGQIGVESVVGLGSNFWFTVSLPIAAEQDLPRLQDAKFAKVFKGNVLVVEDQLVNQRVAQNYLRKLGLEVEVAANGLVAFEKCQSKKYDLIFMDCQMPVLNGFEATKKIRQTEQVTASTRTPIIALTADAGGADKLEYAHSGMDGFLAKPIELPLLFEVLQRWLPLQENTLDLTALAQLESYMVKDQSLVAALIEDLEASAPGLISSMKKSFQDVDETGLSEAAHALKSAAATLGAKRLAELCATVEDLTDVSGAAEFITQIEEQFVNSLNELKNYLSEKNAA
ncbi:MAG: histidine kinase [Bdellovibrio sp. ArHS]|uniref:hybrid sensor histidine kinase/response regulator n=1 Tax=Bdellovibrio sp. ArHS TaxID=1569284 RepID=UPI0005830964|nr:ATP-binding protein [Bdellovibrio sp. ArHS]KHD87645.1 MAG: histidine kinase [Bdellovibrio sp. ArHS]